MGKISSQSQQEPQKEATKTHFSHPHPLKLIPYNQQTPNTPISCSGCNLKPSGLIYSCTICTNYFLHKNCFEMPKKISHPFHKDHSLTLLPAPAYEEGLFNCDACGETGRGFSYHCKPCGIDLHILCAAMPLSVANGCHVHKLDLTFGSPYETKDFCCDVCKRIGSDHWLYRCGSCGFDAHLSCARGVPPVPAAAATSRSAPQAPGHSFGPGYPAMGNHNVAPGVPVGPGPILNHYSQVNRQNNEMLLQALQQMINNNNALTQAMLAGGAPGAGGGLGGVGGNAGLQQLMRLVSSNGGIGGGGMNALQSLMGGGGGGLDFLGCGGGGGLDFLGGGGLDLLSGGGLDFLGGALGGFL